MSLGVYSELIHINAFHQPGVQAYKLASKGVIKLLTDVESRLASIAPFTGTAAELAAKLGVSDSEYELEGIIANVSGNNDKRTLAVNVRREWNKDKGW